MSTCAITAAAAASIAGVGECERRLWRIVAPSATAATAESGGGGDDEASRPASPISARPSSVTRDAAAGSRYRSRSRLAMMMRDILESPTFTHPPEEDPWASTHAITFPSDPDYQDVCYRKMLENQRLRKLALLEEQERLEAEEILKVDQNVEVGKIEVQEEDKENIEENNVGREGATESSAMDEDPLGGAPPPTLHEWNIVPAKPKHAPFHAPQAERLRKRRQSGPGPVTWTIEDIANAGRLLHSPPLPVDFQDEQEMRRVYTLIYDVFRYKNILSQSMDDVQFFQEHPKMLSLTTRVWLLLYDLYHRSFKKRTTANVALAHALFPSAGLADVEMTLWEDRVKLAAAIARIRIKNKALLLSELLPHHLRDEKSCPMIDAPLTCWVNVKKVKSSEDLAQTIKKTLDVKLIDESTTLTQDTFKWDPHCPQFVIFHPSMRSKLVQSVLVRKNKLIIQDKSFCLGPATFVKIISDLQLTGSVIQSHVNSPRTTAYLASILGQNDNIKKLLAFSAGNRKSEYENYFNDLGIKNILIFAEKMIDFPPDSNNFHEVIAVFATPPNSYSAVADPIDLVCSRGGDLGMLEVLTETEDTPAGRTRVASILDEQKQTLKFAMSRPQIQFVLYETHSEIDAENNQMVQKTVKEINKYAKIHHALIQGKIKGLQPSKESSDDNEELIMTAASQQILDDKRIRALNDVVVPETDLFDLSKLPNLCVNQDDCLNPSDKGCYLALVQRKQVTRMDNKYMIQMAENRGVFGAEPNSPKKPKQPQRKRTEDNSPLKKNKFKLKEFEVERMLTATKASLCHSRGGENVLCPRAGIAAGTGATMGKVAQSRRWWAETTRHITNLRVSVSKQKLPVHTLAAGDDNHKTHTKTNNNNNNNALPGKQQRHEEHVQKFITRLMAKGGQVDEVVARSRHAPHTIPIHPKLRLTRHTKCDTKVPVPVTVTMVTFPPTNYW